MHVPVAGGTLTAESAFRLRDVILGIAAEHNVEGHHESVSSRSDMEDWFEKMRLAEAAVREGAAIAVPDEDTEYFIQAFKTCRNQGLAVRHVPEEG